MAEPAVATCSPCFFTGGHAQLAHGGIQLLAAAATSGTSWDQSGSTVGVGSSERGHSTGAQPFLTSPPQPCSVEVGGRGFPRPGHPGRQWGEPGGWTVDDVRFVLPTGDPLHRTRLDLLKWQGRAVDPLLELVEKHVRRCYRRIRRRTNECVLALLDATMITRAETRCYRRRR